MESRSERLGRMLYATVVLRFLLDRDGSLVRCDVTDKKGKRCERVADWRDLSRAVQMCLEKTTESPVGPSMIGGPVLPGPGVEGRRAVQNSREVGEMAADDIAIAELKARLESMKSAERIAAATAAGEVLTEKEKQEVVARWNLMPNQATASLVWRRIVTAFVIVLVGAFFAIAASIFLDKPIDTLLTVFTTAAGFLAGLLAPSPVSGR